jgi:hypothetical protein
MARTRDLLESCRPGQEALYNGSLNFFRLFHFNIVFYQFEAVNTKTQVDVGVWRFPARFSHDSLMIWINGETARVQE